MNNYTRKQVAEHNKEKDAWIIINGNVYNMTKFLLIHPGGEKVVLDLLGDDASEDFHMNHPKENLFIIEKYKIGTISE